MQTANELREYAAQRERDNARRYDEDELGLSMWASGLSAEKARLQAEILDRGGLWEFNVLCDTSGAEVNAKAIDGKYGKCWALLDSNGRFTGVFFGTGARAVAKRGYHYEARMLPAKAIIAGSGHGLAGAASCYVMAVRTDQ